MSEARRILSTIPAPPLHRPTKYVVIGFLAGAIAASSLAYLVKRPVHVAVESASPFLVNEDTVRLRAGAPTPLAFETTVVQLGEPLPYPPVTGRVKTLETFTAPSFAPLTGRVVDVRVRIGAHVAVGDKLVEVRTGDLAAMQRDVRGARLAVKTKQAIADRLAQLVEARAASNNDLLVARSELEDSKFSVQAADARLRSLMVQQDGEMQYWILANRAGVVVQLEASPGKLVGPDSEKPVATVADLNEVLILADVPQRQAALLDEGFDASILLPGTSKQIAGKIEDLSQVVDSERQTVPIRIRAGNSERTLRPNGYVDVVFSSGATDKILVVPSAAVVTDGEASVVFVEVEPGVLKRRIVQLGRQTKEKVHILSGLSAGEKVVTRGALLLLNALNIQG